MRIRNFIIISLISVITASCVNTQIKESLTQFDGEHKLRTISVADETKESWSGYYFIIGGKASGSKITETMVSFSWQLPSEEYVFSSVPLSKVRVKLDDSIETPYISFVITGLNHTNYPGDHDINGMIKFGLDYIVVHCKSEDWPQDLDLTGLK